MKPHLSHVLNIINDFGLTSSRIGREKTKGANAPRPPMRRVAGLSDRTFSPISARAGDHRVIISGDRPAHKDIGLGEGRGVKSRIAIVKGLRG